MSARPQDLLATVQEDRLNQIEAARVQDAFQILNYNQQLIQFADSKAGNLIVVNSLFIAASQADRLHDGGFWLLQAAYVVLACLAVLYCLTVITARLQPGETGRKDLIFFDDILSHQGSRHYLRAFRDIQPSQQLDDILRRTHTLAGIAQRKFLNFGTAQRLTVWAAGVWVAANLASLLPQTLRHLN